MPELIAPIESANVTPTATEDLGRRTWAMCADAEAPLTAETFKSLMFELASNFKQVSLSSNNSCNAPQSVHLYCLRCQHTSVVAVASASCTFSPSVNLQVWTSNNFFSKYSVDAKIADGSFEQFEPRSLALWFVGEFQKQLLAADVGTQFVYRCEKDKDNHSTHFRTSTSPADEFVTLRRVMLYEEKEEIQDYEMQIVNCNFWLRFEPLLQDSSMIYQLPDRITT